MPDADVTETETIETETDTGTEELEDTEQTDDAATEDGTEDEADDAETFPAEVVRKRRRESAAYRDRLRESEDRTEAVGKRLHSALVGATGKLQDPSDLPYAAEHLDSPEALSVAIDELLAAKPHLKSRKPTGDVGQGVKGDQTSDVDLLGLLRQRA